MHNIPHETAQPYEVNAHRKMQTHTAYTYAHNYKKHKHPQLDKAQAHTY